MKANGVGDFVALVLLLLVTPAAAPPVVVVVVVEAAVGVELGLILLLLLLLFVDGVLVGLLFALLFALLVAILFGFGDLAPAATLGEVALKKKEIKIIRMFLNDKNLVLNFQASNRSSQK